MDLASINPRKLHLFNKGQEVPIYFHGGGDGSFDSADYFEFWGEKNLNDLNILYPEIYNDPFSDINVYWLYESDANGLRLVEESGALIEPNPANYLVPSYYNEHIHFEEDNYFAHFGKDKNKA